MNFRLVERLLARMKSKRLEKNFRAFWYAAAECAIAQGRREDARLYLRLRRGEPLQPSASNHIDYVEAA